MNVLIGIIVLLLIVAILVYVYLVVIDKRLCNEKDPWHVWLCKNLHGNGRCSSDHVLSNDGTTCLKCPDGKGVVNVKEIISYQDGGNIIECVIDRCEDGYITSNDRRRCLQCPSDRLNTTGVIEENGNCILTGCVDGYFLSNDKKRCIPLSTCPQDENISSTKIVNGACIIDRCEGGYTPSSDGLWCIQCPLPGDELSPHFVYNDECIKGARPGMKARISQINNNTQFTLRLSVNTGPCNYFLQLFSVAVYWNHLTCTLKSVNVGSEYAPWNIATDLIRLPKNGGVIPQVSKTEYSISQGGDVLTGDIFQSPILDDFYDYPSYRGTIAMGTTNEIDWNRPELPSYEFNKCKTNVFVVEMTFDMNDNTTTGIIDVINSVNTRSFTNQGVFVYDGMVPYPAINDGTNKVFTEGIDNDWSPSNMVPILDKTNLLTGATDFEGKVMR